MRIENEQINQGYFWLPSNPNKKIPGTLSIKNGGKVELEVIGHFDDGFATLTEQIELNRIIGLVENHNLITLEKCFYKNKNFSFGGVSRSKIHVNQALAGVEYEQEEQLSFESISFSVDGLEEWVGMSGISVQHEKDF